MSKNTLSINMKNKKGPKNIFDNEFLTSKDKALQPITFFSECNCNLEKESNNLPSRHLSLKNKKNIDRPKKSASSKNSRRSQKSTTNSNRKSERKKSLIKSELYNSNIIIINDKDCSPTDHIQKEVEKLKKLMEKHKKKKGNKANNNNKNKNIEYI